MSATRPAEPRLSRVAALVADTSRSRMLCFLLDGSWASATELAAAAGISPATASGHLRLLLDAGLMVCEQRGRHRYHRLADADVARALEALALVAERGSHERAWSSPARARLREARCCYGHLAGRIGVELLQNLLALQWLTPAAHGGYAITSAGAAGFTELGLDGAGWQRKAGAGGRGVAYACLDWSERRDHLAGTLASAFLTQALARGWLRRAAGPDAAAEAGPGRALQCTPPGTVALGRLVGVIR